MRSDFGSRILFSWLRTGLLLAAILPAACTKTVLLQGYKNADTLLYMRADNYFKFTDDQAPFVKARLKETMAWHKKEELPRIAGFLSEAAKRSSDHLDENDFTWMQNQVLSARDRTLGRVEPDCAEFLTKVEPWQLGTFAKQFDKDSVEIFEELRAPEAKKAAIRAKRVTDFLEFWTGSLTKEQTAHALSIAKDLPDLTPIRLAYRAHGRAVMEEMIRQKANPKRMREFLRSYWLLPGAHPDPVAQQYSLRSWESLKTGVLKMDPVLTAEQRAKAVARMEELALDLKKISMEQK